eukprot:TRINITY_DN46885_c0_g1_i1.p2 TRINITY_DN46885_c0_g1~~TRINITY_DN46885_c0_g1_i1.p2  ORF type:complete len:108 (+),score=24.97 TRINITY_DN46885_c0_g1_i1:48-326(+)
MAAEWRALVEPRAAAGPRGNDGRWFSHRDVWFDAADPTTERYMLYGVPYLAQRLVVPPETVTADALAAEMDVFRKAQAEAKAVANAKEPTVA